MTAARVPRELLPGAWRREPDGRARLLVAHCGRCGARTFPPPAFCPRCWAREQLTLEPLPRTGVLHAFSVVHVRSAGVEPPYAVCCVDYPDGIRLTGRLSEWDGVAVGDAVEPVTGELRSGDDPLVGWLFRRAQP
jgi:uncharacterized OB-fold protein